MSARALIRVGLVIALAVVAGLLLRGLFVVSTAPKAPKPVATRAVRVAAHPLPVGLLLREDDLGWREVPESQLTPAMIAKDSPNAARLAGAVVRQAIAEGADIAARDVVFADAAGFLAAALSPGLRAVSVAIDDVTGNAGLIQPGDRVDLLLTQKLDTGMTGDMPHPVASETILSDLRVIAVGSSMKMPDGNAAPAAPPRPARTVTLEVTPEQAEKVAVATRLGQLSLALRSLANPQAGTESAGPRARAANPEDNPDKPVWAEDVSMAVRALVERHPQAPPPGPQPVAELARPVQVFRGSQRGNGPGTLPTEIPPGLEGLPATTQAIAPALPTGDGQRLR
jgi:pilus assembly protein CpaB